MPPGVPVACVGLDNAKNAAVLAARILVAGEARPPVDVETAIQCGARQWGLRPPSRARQGLALPRRDVMDLEPAIRTRRTHKVYGPQPVAPETVAELVELARERRTTT